MELEKTGSWKSGLLCPDTSRKGTVLNWVQIEDGTIWWLIAGLETRLLICRTWVFICCMTPSLTLATLPNLCKSQLLHLQNGGNNSAPSEDLMRD